MSNYVRWFDDLTSDDLALLGGKNASLGELIASVSEAGVRVPAGFAVTVDGYRALLEADKLTQPIRAHVTASAPVSRRCDTTMPAVAARMAARWEALAESAA